MTNCSFNQFKDLVGIHEALFSSLINGGTIQESIKNLEGYLKIYNQDFADFTQDRLEEFSADLAEAVRIGLEIFSEVNTQAKINKNFDAELASFDPGNTIINDTISKFLPEGLHFRDTNLKIENSITGETAEPSTIKPELLVEQNSNVVTAADNQIIDFNTKIPVANGREVSDRYYSGVGHAYNKLINASWNKVYDNIILPFTLGEMNTVTDLNDAITEFKNELFNNLLKPNSKFKNMFRDNFDADKYQKVLDKVRSDFNNYNNKKGLSIADVRKMMLNDSYAKDKLIYDSYVLLSNFDNLLSDISSNLIDVYPQYHGVEIGISNKYYPKMDDGKMRTGYRESDIEVSGLTQLSDFFNNYIGNLKIYSTEGIKTIQSLTPMSVINTITKFNKSLNYYDLPGTLKSSIQETLRNYYDNALPKEFDKSDVKNLLTLYVNVYRGTEDVNTKNNTIEKIIKSEIGGRTLTAKMIKNIADSITKPSLMSSFQKFNPVSGKLNLFEMLSANMAKLDSTNYFETIVNPSTGAITRVSFLNREVDSQFYQLKSLGVKASLNGEAKLKSDLSYAGDFTGYDMKQTGTTFNINTIGNVSIDYNLITGKFIKDGVQVDNLDVTFSIPDSEINLQDVDANELKKSYPDYFSIIEAFDKFVGQSLSSQNYALLDMFREMSDYKDKGKTVPGHLEAIIKIMANYSYISHLNAYGLKGDINGDLNKVRSAIISAQTAMVPKGSAGFSFDDLWDSKNNNFKIELSKTPQAGYGALREYSRVLNNYYNTSIRPIAINSEGNALPTQILATLINRVSQITKGIKNETGVLNAPSWIDHNGDVQTKQINSVFRKNLFAQNDGLISGIEVNGGIKNRTGDTSASGKMTIKELTIAAINGNFLNSWLDGSETSFQTTNYSDKGKHSSVNIDRNFNTTFNLFNRVKTDTWQNMTTSDFQEAYLVSVDDYHNNLINNILNDYERVLRNSHDSLTTAFAESNDYLSVLDYDPLTGELLPFNPELLQNENFRKAYETYEKLNELTKLPFPSDPLAKVKHINSIISNVSQDVLMKAFVSANVTYTDTLYAENGALDNEFKGKLTLNNSIEHYLTRYKQQNALETYADIENDFIKSLDRIGFNLELRDNQGKEDYNIKRFLYEMGNGTKEQKQIVNNIKQNFLDTDLGILKNYYVNAAGNTVLNPILKRYLYESLLVNRNFQLLTVGSSMAHPHKVKDINTTVDGVKTKRSPTPKELESGRLTSQNKRMVSLQAAGHPVILNTLNGLPGITRSVTIIDPKRSVDTFWGNSDGVETTDGSTFSNPIHIMLFNESLAGEHGGSFIKSLRSTVDPVTGKVELLKHAEYSITNLNVLRGYSENSGNKYLNMIERTMSDDFTKLFGNIPVDITLDYKGDRNEIVENKNHTFVYANTLSKDFDSVSDFVSERDLIKVTGLTSNGNNNYTFTYKNLSTEEDFSVNRDITNLYDLWRMMGAEQSVTKDLNEVGKFEQTADTVLDGYIPSLSSFDIVKDFTNSVGFTKESLEASVGPIKTKEVFKKYKTEYLGNVDVSDASYMSQLTVIQPLKHSLIGQLSFKSAVKVGAMNAISLDNFNNGKPFKSNRHSALFYVQQLSAEHAIGEASEVVEQSQIITALSFPGMSPETASKTFNAISSYVSGSMISLLPKITGMKLNEVDKAEVKKVMRKILSRALETRDNMGMANTVVNLLKKEIAENSSPIFNIPASSPDLYNTIFTTISNFLTSEGIRRNLPGLPAVLKASVGFMGIRNVHVLDPITNMYVQEPMTEEDYQNYAKNNPNRVSKLNYAENRNFDVDLFTTVIELTRNEVGDVINENPIYMKDVATYLATKRKMMVNPNNYVIDLDATRELKPTTFSWTAGTVTNANGDVTNDTVNILDTPISVLANTKKSYSELNNNLKGLNKSLELYQLLVLNNSNIPELVDKYTVTIQSLLNTKANIEADIQSLRDTFQGVIELSGINNIIEYVNTGTTFLEDGTINNVEDVKYNPINSIEDLSSGYNDLFKNILNKQYRLVNEGFTKPSVFNYQKYANDLETGVYDANGSYISTLGDYLKKHIGLTFEQAIGKEDIYFKAENLVQKPGEILAPSIYKDRLGLSSLHTPSNVTENTFFRIAQKLSRPTTDLHDLFATSGNGSNTYIVFQGSENHKQLLAKHNLAVDESVNIQTDPLNENDYYVYNRKGEKVIKVPFDKMYSATINNTKKNYIVIPKGGEAEIKSLLRSEGGLYNKIIPNMHAVDRLGGIKLLNDYGIIQSNAKITKHLNKIDSLLEKGLETLRNSEVRVNAIRGVNSLNYFDSEWADGKIKNHLEELETLTEPRDRARSAAFIKLLENYKIEHAEFTATRDTNVLDKVLDSLNKYRLLERRTDDMQKRTKILERSKKSLEHFTQILQDIQEEYYQNGDAKDRALAKEQYASYRAAMNISAARIPGQHLQSYMGQRIVGFTNDEENMAYVSSMHMLITGEDFDIDKAYLTYYGLNKKDGTLKGWTKAWRGSSVKELEISLTLPIPTDITLGDVLRKESIMGLNQLQVESLAKYKNGDLSVDVFKNVAKALNKVSVMQNKINSFDNAATNIIIHTDVKVDENILKDALDAIVAYNNDTQLDPETDDYFNEGMSNAITNGIIATGNDIRNTNIQTSPVTFGEFSELADKSQKGVIMKQMSYENPLDIYAAQVYAMVGKDVIAIAAAGGLKPYGTLTYNTAHIKNRGVGKPMKLMNRAFNGNNINENIITSVSIDDPVEIDNVINNLVSIASENSPIKKAIEKYGEDLVREVLYSKFMKLGYTKGDAALNLSAILSAATDNAKELILERINAGPDTVGYYLAAMILEMPAKDIGNIMQSDTVEKALKLSERNLFKGPSSRFENALQQLKAGKLQINSYFDKDTVFSITQAILSADFKIGDYSIKEYLKFAVDPNPKNVTPEALDKGVKALLNRPYSILSELLNADTARTTKIDYSELIANIRKATANISVTKAPEGLEYDNKYRITRTSGEETAEFDEFSNDFFSEGNEYAGEYDDTGDFGDFEQDFDMDNDSVSDFFDSDESFSSVYSKKMPASILLNRYLADVEYYLKDVDMSVINFLEQLEPFKNDLNVLGRMLGVNQGVKNTFFDLYKYGELIDTYIKENFPVFVKLNPNLSISEIMNSYYTDEAFKNKLDSYFRLPPPGEDHKFTSNLNLLDLVFNTGHMSAMQNIAFKNAEWNDNIGLKSRIMKDIADTTDIKMTNSNYGIIQSLSNDLVILNTLERVGSENQKDVIFTATKGQLVDPLQKPISADAYEMDVRTIEGRKDFLNWFESTVIPTLKKSRTTLSNGEEIKIDLEGNNFLNALIIDSKMDRNSGERYHYYTIKMDTNKRSDTQSLMMNDILIDDFATMRDVKFNGKPLTDLFFLYNMLIFRGRGTKGSFTNFLSVVSDGYQNDNLMSKFVKQMGWIDNNSVYRGDGSDGFDKLWNIDDLYIKGYAKDVQFVPKVFDGEAVKVLRKNSNDKWINDVYKWVSSSNIKPVKGSSEGTYVKLNPHKYNERIINISISKDASDSLRIDNTEEILKKTLSKLFNSNFEIKLDENC